MHAICPQGVRTQMLEDAGPLQALLSRDSALEPEQVADAAVAAIDEGRFLVLPHPEVAGYYAARASRHRPLARPACAGCSRRSTKQEDS